MYCRECGREMPDGVKFCAFCGTKTSQRVVNETKEESSQKPEGGVKEELPGQKAEEVPRGSKSTKKKWTRYIVIAFVLLVIFYIIGRCTTPDDDGTDTAYESGSEEKKPQYTQVTLEELYRKSDFYEGKKVAVEGIVWKLFDNIAIYQGFFENLVDVSYDGKGYDPDGNVVGNVMNNDKVYVVGTWEGLDSLGQGQLDADIIYIIEQG